ncbi:hypothetical protein Pla52o_15060 [Novipirellula galeiformis]|uniref:Uncharacterized protein n=1 Tax=Novipirellula galeiformis TaxID=2528004 RepID=A0A5C6CL81_9BACT|nr:hypothetical protein [Novipirellula galeiformis]TWU25208.1 hypothetical protein Pla52o_15060 [Novipirellula galeiformis]
MLEFTPTQGRYLSYIHAYTSGFGLPPAESEIAKPGKERRALSAVQTPDKTV